MAIAHAPRRGDPDTTAPGTFRQDGVRLVVQAAREFVDAGNGTSGEAFILAGEKLRAAVQVLDTIEGRQP